MKSWTLFVIFVVGTTSVADAGLFAKRVNRTAGRQQSSSNRTSSQQQYNANTSAYNKTGQPLTRFGHRWVERKHAQDLKTAERTGQAWEDVEAKRMKRLNTFAAILGGAADGLSGAADSLNYSSPTPGLSQSPRGLRSGFSNSSQRDAFNRSYSMNPDHAPVTSP